MKANSSTPKSPNRRRGGLNVYDVLFVLFKHKWKIILLSLLGFAGAGGLLFWDLRSPSYETDATLLVRYVLERSNTDPFESKLDPSGSRGMMVMDAEIEIIKGADVALEVAAKVGPEKILAGKSPTPTKTLAAIQIARNLRVVAARDSNVIHLKFHHPDPEVAFAVLKELIDIYFEKHLEIHRSTGAFESVQRQTDQARSRLSQTEQELNKMNSDSGFISLADGKSALELRRNSLRESLMAARVELAEQKVKVASLEATLGVAESTQPKGDPEHAEEGVPERMARTRAQVKYHDLAEQLTLFKQRRNTLMMTRKPGDPMITALDRQIAAVQQQGLDLIEAHPGLISQAKSQEGTSPQATGTDLNSERAQLAALEEKCKALTDQSKEVDAEVEKISANRLAYTNLERRRQLEEEKYRYAETSLEKARVDESLNPTKMPNIGVVQNPSAPIKMIADTTLKFVIGLAASGILSGLALAFLIEWVIDRRVSRPIEIQTRLQLPLMMSIPRFRAKDRPAKQIARDTGDKLLGDTDKLIFPPELPNGIGDLAPQENEQFISPYAGAIRDRIMFNFELNNITHKPKLVGVTGLSQGAGTSTIAVGLAKALAEDGKDKVLLVDLNPTRNGSALPAYPMESLHTALDISRAEWFRQSPRSLFFARTPSRRNGKGVQALTSIALHEMMPQLEACDFDYIVFDMPPVGPTSPTIAMAGFMDKVLLVLDAENTNRESLSWSYAELEKGRADVSCVFNKVQPHAPRWVAGEM